MTIIKSIMYVNFEEPRSRDSDFGTLNLRKKTAIFVSKIYLFAYGYKIAERGTLKFEHNVSSVSDSIHTKFRGAHSCDRNFKGRK